MNCNIKQYTDDTKLYTTIRNNDDLFQFQHDLDTIAEWSNTWQLSFSYGKCKHLQVGMDYNWWITRMVWENLSVMWILSKILEFGVQLIWGLYSSAHAVSKVMKALGLIKGLLSFSALLLFLNYVKPMFAPKWSTVYKCGLHFWLVILMFWKGFNTGLPN